MHHCLLIPEVVELICDQVSDLYGLGSDLERKPQLLALAQTCSIFKNPALARFWKTVDSIIPVIQCVGTDFWRIRSPDRGRDELYLARPVTSSDIAVMMKYTRLVRHYGFTWSPHALSSVAPEVWKTLYHALEGVVLFPKLLSMICDSEGVLEFNTLFGVQDLTSFKFLLRCLPQPSSLVEFASRCPDLTNLELIGVEKLEELQVIAATLPNWPKLSSLMLGRVGPQDSRALAHYSSSLRFLLIRDITSSDGERLLPLVRSDASILPKLESIQVGFKLLSDAIRFFEYLPVLDTLRHLSLTIKRMGPLIESFKANDWPRLLGSLRRHSSTLKALEISDGPDHEDRRMIIVPDTLASALATNGLTRLTSLKFNIQRGFVATDVDLENLTQALPLLEEFVLCNPERDYEGTICFKNTIACLASFSRNCSFLTYLIVEFDARADRVPATIPGDLHSYGPSSTSIPDNQRGVQQSNLESLHVSYSLIDSQAPALVARYISTLFPRLKHFAWNVNKDRIQCSRALRREILDEDLMAYRWLDVHNLLLGHEGTQEVELHESK